MTVEEITRIMEPDEFRAAIVDLCRKRGLTDKEMCFIIRARSKYLAEKYKPEDMEWHRKIYGKKRSR